MTSIPSETCRLRLVKHMVQPHTSFISYGRPIRAKVGLNRTGDMSATPQTPMLHRVINPVKCQCFPMMTALRGDVPNLLLPQQGAPQVDGKTSASMIFHAFQAILSLSQPCQGWRSVVCPSDVRMHKSWKAIRGRHAGSTCDL